MREWYSSNRWAALVHDLLSIPVAWLGAYWLRFNLGQIPPDILLVALKLLPLALLLQTSAFWIFGLYRGVWRFASLPDLIRIVKAVALGSVAIVIGFFWLLRLPHLPRSVPILYSLILLFILGGSRFLYRWFKNKPVAQGKKVLIVGAGLAAESLIRDLLRRTSDYLPVVLVDDDPAKQGQELHGIRVMGSCERIPQLVKSYQIEMILIALPSANGAQMRRITAICESTQKSVRTLPGVNDLVSGRISVKILRELSLADLLGRDPITLDWQAISSGLANKVVLISGGGGSIGAELCRQALRLNPKKLIIVDNSEYNLFCIQQEFIEKSLTTQVDYHLGDVTDYALMQKLIQAQSVQIIFHAAAYKHVPLLEPQARAAVKNNVLGTYCLAQIALNLKVEKFVLVSSDKAVNPTNVMGATKRIAELVCQYFNRYQITQFITVRFGNVLGSRGSVIETFQRQLEKGGPLTVTDPEISRYFMTLCEASQLILQALAIGQGGELFVLDMGEPVKIRYLAEQIIRLAGKHQQIPIKYIGLRPGEKLHEELFHQRETLMKTAHPKILKVQSRSLERNFKENLVQLRQAVELGENDILPLIQSMVPELNYLQPRLKETTV